MNFSVSSIAVKAQAMESAVQCERPRSEQPNRAIALQSAPPRPLTTVPRLCRCALPLLSSFRCLLACAPVPPPSSLFSPPCSFLPLHERGSCIRSFWHIDAEWRVRGQCGSAVQRQRRRQQRQRAHARIPRRAEKGVQQKYHQGTGERQRRQHSDRRTNRRGRESNRIEPRQANAILRTVQPTALRETHAQPKSVLGAALSVPVSLHCCVCTHVLALPARVSVCRHESRVAVRGHRSDRVCH